MYLLNQHKCGPVATHVIAESLTWTFREAGSFTSWGNCCFDCTVHAIINSSECTSFPGSCVATFKKDYVKLGYKKHEVHLCITPCPPNTLRRLKFDKNSQPKFTRGDTWGDRVGWRCSTRLTINQLSATRTETQERVQWRCQHAAMPPCFCSDRWLSMWHVLPMDSPGRERRASAIENPHRAQDLRATTEQIS